MIGTTIGNYRIVERLGDGGMGAVFRAIDEMLDREVAIKVLRPELARNAALIERFRQEAIALARLNHPRIATLHGLERHDASFLMIMEYVRGETLEAIVQRSGRLSWARAAELCAATLDALDHAHDKGVVHRDIKPANIMLATSGALKVMDFGIARLMGKSRQTQIGHAVGTPMYMAPEQLRGEEVDGRTDLYAAGAVLFELVTGRMAFEADSDYALMMRQLNDPPPAASSIVRDVPSVIDDIIQRAMAKRREDRFPHASAFREALESAIGSLAPPSRRTPVPAETRLAAPAVDTTATAEPPVAAVPPAARGTAPAANHDVQATAERGLTPPPGVAETRLADPAAARSVPPAATRLADARAAHGAP
ncbi:MAG: protein kinase, partial [Gemmatimonadaceae bacterium]|nr:protein kinase [Gemmatimonadaceae bacterium]